MKNPILTLILLIFITSCKKEIIKVKEPQKTDGYHIIGQLKEFNNKTVFLQHKSTDKTYNTVKTTLVKNNLFRFNGKVSNPKLVYIGFKNTDYKIPVIANNFETIIAIDIKDLDKTKVTGSTLQKDYNNYSNELQQAKNKFVYKLNYIKTNNNSVLSAIILKQMLGKTKWRLGQNRKAYNYLSAKIKDTEQGKLINTFLIKNEPLVKDEIVVEELSLNPEVANIIPETQVIKEAPKTEVKPVVVIKKRVTSRRKALNFSAESQHGKDISLLSVRKNAKVTLVDFWASWCGPCRETHPHLKRLYKKYHAKGFEIISVSEDKEKDKNKWLNAIAVDGLPWQQVIDDYGRVAEMYNVQRIPHSFLLDQNGGIIFEKKSSYTIEQKLKEIFGF